MSLESTTASGLLKGLKMNSDDKSTPRGALDKALEGGVPAGDLVIFGNTPKVNMVETPYSYFPTQVPVYLDAMARPER